MTDKKTIKNFMAAIREQAKGTKAYDTQATVTRIEGGTAWVHIPGGVEETPAKMTINANVGDTVQVRIGGGRAWLTGNGSAPPTDDRTANTAIATADAANKLAVVANDAAQSAVASAATAAQAADDAQTSADAAQTSADNAATSARAALLGLATMESVVDVVNWFAEHKTASTDTTVDSTKTYYTYNATTGVLTKVDPEGAENPSELGWYEMGEAIAEYVATHVAQTNDGLSVIGAANGWRVLISSGTGNYAAGVFLIDPSGNVAQSTTASGITFNENKAFYIGDEDAFILFDGNGNLQIGGTGIRFGSESLSSVLNRITAAQTSADSKCQVFTSEPTTPYNAGDLWVDTTEAEYTLTEDTAIDPDKTYYQLISDEYVEVASPVVEDIATYYELTEPESTVTYVCTTSKSTGAFDDADWKISSTDDTVANGLQSAIDDANDTISETTATLQGQIDNTNELIEGLDTRIASTSEELSALQELIGSDGSGETITERLQAAISQSLANLAQLEAISKVIEFKNLLLLRDPTEGSNLNVALSGAQMEFRYGDAVMAYLNSLGFHFTNGELENQLRIGNFLLTATQEKRFDILYDPVA